VSPHPSRSPLERGEGKGKRERGEGESVKKACMGYIQALI
jgi:hypothetical protein